MRVSLLASRRLVVNCALLCLQVAQAISTRVDILSPEYLIEIERLQDDVAPFPTSQVMGRPSAPWGSPASEIVRLSGLQ